MAYLFVNGKVFGWKVEFYRKCKQLASEADMHRSFSLKSISAFGCCSFHFYATSV